MEAIRKILASYAVYPLKIEKITDAVFRIEDGQQVYALKRSALSKQTIVDWENIYHLANSQNVSGILPVYVTKQGYLYEESNNTFFYLTPWMEAGRQNIERLYYCIGSVHAKTKQSHTVETEAIQNRFHTYKKHCEYTRETLLHAVEQFEKERYMSPVELLICMQYRDLELVFKRIIMKIDQFIQEQKEQSAWNYSLCHGNLEFPHLLNATHTYITNWEKSHYGNPIHDLVHLFNHEVTEYDAPVESFMKQFTTYMDENELSKSELYLLTIYLLDPTDYVTLVEHYINKTATGAMVDQIKTLQHAYRRLIFGLRWSDYVNETYDTFSLDEMES